MSGANSYSYGGYSNPPPYTQPTAPPNEGGYSYPAYPDGGYGSYPPQPQAANTPLQTVSNNSVQPQDDMNVESNLNQFAGDSFSDKKIRHAFIRKVYLILMIQLAFTVAIICLFIFIYPVRIFVQANQAIYWVSYGVFIATYIVLICIPSVRRKVPGNYICLIIFTLALTYMTATISSFYNTNIVMIALAITAAVCLAITIFAIQTKIDFTLCYGLLFALCMVLLFFGLAVLITYLVTGPSFSTYVMSCVYGGLAALVFSLFLVFDTQRVIGGRNYQLSEEEYIYGALELYLDIVQIFLALLSITGLASK